MNNFLEPLSRIEFKEKSVRHCHH